MVERFGWYSGKFDSATVWIHTVSVGEFMASIPIIESMLTSQNRYKIVVTTTTMTASALVEQTFGEKVEHVFLPYDVPMLLKGFFQKFQPNKLVLLETELWPNLLNFCYETAVPVFLVNARLSLSSFNRYRILKAIMFGPLGPITKIGAQNIVHASRFCELGYPESSVFITGNLKFEVKAESIKDTGLLCFLNSLRSTRKILVCGSTRKGEEIKLLAAVLRLKKKHPELFVILVPRHPQRSTKVGQLCSQKGLRYQYRSQIEEEIKNQDVLIIDTIGELLACYSVCQLAFVGGSLVPHGGHNVLEPSRFGVPVLVGPHTENFEDEVELLSSVGALQIVHDENDIVDQVSYLFENGHKRTQLGKRGRQVIADQIGSLQRTEELICD
ncbi:MAG: 3-deoxy-D-manno-octulosonic acid transferase [Pseudomonadota bacterium]|nr:3-deoxy-D-manno-octulosonic acid transferase [Pseudomonadota bacterium]